MSNIVPFGKYKGQPLENLLSDENYVQWLQSQEWVKEKYTVVYNIINQVNFEDQPTPEHNAMQIKWLDKKYQENFLKMYFSKNIKYNLFLEKEGWDLIFEFDVGERKCSDFSRRQCVDLYCIELKPIISDDYPAILRKMLFKRIPERKWFIIPNNRQEYIRPHFDFKGNRINYNMNEKIIDGVFYFLITQKFESSVINLDQVYDFFFNNDIEFILESDFEK